MPCLRILGSDLVSLGVYYSIETGCSYLSPTAISLPGATQAWFSQTLYPFCSPRLTEMHGASTVQLTAALNLYDPIRRCLSRENHSYLHFTCGLNGETVCLGNFSHVRSAKSGRCFRHINAVWPSSTGMLPFGVLTQEWRMWPFKVMPLTEESDSAADAGIPSVTTHLARIRRLARSQTDYTQFEPIQNEYTTSQTVPIRNQSPLTTANVAQVDPTNLSSGSTQDEQSCGMSRRQGILSALALTGGAPMAPLAQACENPQSLAGNALSNSTSAGGSQKSATMAASQASRGPIRSLASSEAFSAERRVVQKAVDVFRDPRVNQGLALCQEERKRLGLKAFLPAGDATAAVEIRRAERRLARVSDPLQQYEALVALQAQSEAAFYGLVAGDLERWLPILYTPTVGDACLSFGTLGARPRGLWVSKHDGSREAMAAAVGAWPEEDVRIAVITDGERILGLGDLGAHGMAIAAGKAMVYVTGGGLRPSQVVPVLVDVGTDNAALRADEFYMGLREKRLRGAAYLELMDTLVTALQERYGDTIVIHWEDVGAGSAFALLDRYTGAAAALPAVAFNDDVQSTAAVAVAGVLSALRLTRGRLKDQRFLFLGAGQASLGTAALLLSALAHAGLAPSEAASAIWLFDSQGLVFEGRDAPISAMKRRYAHPPAAARNFPDFPRSLEECVRALRPTALIGASGVGGAFTSQVLSAMAAVNERPIVFALSNPISRSECTPAEALGATAGAAVFASGSPFPPVVVRGTAVHTGFANNAFIFPGIGLGAVASGSTALCDDLFLAAARALAGQVSEEDLQRGSIYPSTNRLREAALAVATSVVQNASISMVASVASPEAAMCLSQVASTTKLKNCIKQLMYRPPGWDSKI